MKEYLSYSEMYSWMNYKEDYYARYIEGKPFEPNEKMILGTIIHKAMENPSYEWIKAMKDAGFHKKQQASVRKILTNSIRERGKQQEVTLTATTPDGVKLLGIFDSYDPDFGYLWDYKTTDNEERWNQRSVDYNYQLSFYAYIYWLTHWRYFQRISIVKMNTETGNVRRYDTVRSRKDIVEMAKRISLVVGQMKDEGIWEKRLSRKEIEAKNAYPKTLV